MSEQKEFWHQWKGVPVDESRRNKWAHDVVKYLIENPEEYFAYSMSGDSVVFAHKTVEEDGSTEIEVYDAKVVRKAGIY